MYSITILSDDMGRPKNQIPTLRHHKVSGQSFIVWAGQTVYLGSHGSLESIDNYNETVKNIKLYGKTVVDKTDKVSLKTIGLKYLESLPENYPKTSREPIAIRRAIEELIRWSGDDPAESFKPARFLELRKAWVEKGRSVKTIGNYHSYVLNMFRWAAIMELVPASVWHSLQAIPKLKPNRSPAKNPKMIHPVEWKAVEAVKPFVSTQVWDMIMLQWWTAMRSGELLGMTKAEIEDGVYRPAKHKNAWRGHKREVFIGPRAKPIIQKYSKGKEPHELLFTGYTNNSYGRAIKRACKRAGIDYWHPHQLRHAAADRARDAFGLDAAQAVLGHKTANTTEIYAKVKRTLAKKAAEDLG